MLTEIDGEIEASQCLVLEFFDKIACDDVKIIAGYSFCCIVNLYMRSVRNTLENLFNVDEIGRLETLYKVDATGLPIFVHPHTFFLRRNKDEEVHVLVASDEERNTEHVVCDPYKFTNVATSSIRNFFVSPDGKYVLCEISEHSNDVVSFEIFTTDGACVDSVPAKFFPRKPCWNPDSIGFWYARCAKKDATNGKLHRQLFYHNLGDVVEKDEYIFGESIDIQDAVLPFISTDGAYLVLQVNIDTGKKRTQDIYVQKSEGVFRKIICGETLEQSQWYANVCGSTLFLYTNYQAPNWRVIAMALEDVFISGEPLDTARTVLPEKEWVLEKYTVTENSVIGEYAQDMRARVEQRTHNGAYVHSIDMPEYSTVAGFGSTRDGVCIAITSFSIRLDLSVFDESTGKCALFHSSTPKSAPKIVVRLMSCISKDGTSIPMFIVHKKNKCGDMLRPTLLYGYGGFNYSSRPAFRTYVSVFVEHGGVFVLPILHGGKEYGESWHEACLRGNKQKVFNDFTAVGEYMCKEKITSHEHLAIAGWSNGGLLTATTIVQNPTFARVAILGGPVTDMLSFHTFNDGGCRWRSEFGNPEDAHDREFLKKYSPLHNIASDTSYPATMVVVSTHDDRVDPVHSRLFVEKLRSANVSDAPIVLREERSVGHEGSPCKSTRIQMEVDIIEFIITHT